MTPGRSERGGFSWGQPSKFAVCRNLLSADGHKEWVLRRRSAPTERVLLRKTPVSLRLTGSAAPHSVAKHIRMVYNLEYDL